MATRETLLAAAHGWAQTLRTRPGVVAIFLYGSLTGDPAELTDFSDVDVALALEDDAMPAHFAEHRLWNGVKTDTTLLRASVLRRWASDPPTSLDDGHWVHGLFLKALLLGGDDIVLHDPHGLVAAARRALPSYRSLALPDTRSWLDAFSVQCLSAAQTALAEGDAATARQKLPDGWLAGGARYLTGKKRLDAAAAQLGDPELATVLKALEAIGSPPPEVWEAACDAVEALGRHIEDDFYRPAIDALRRQGDPDPDAREIVGDWPVFWGGNRVHTIGRIAAEWEVSRRWSRQRRAAGRWSDARDILWPSEPGAVEERAVALRDALAAQGFDIAAETAAFLHGETLARRNAAALAAEARRTGWPVSLDEAREALALATDAHRRLTAAVGESAPEFG